MANDDTIVYKLRGAIHGIAKLSVALGESTCILSGMSYFPLSISLPLPSCLSLH